MTKQVKKRLSRQERYDTLIDATFRCVAQNGLDGTTIRDIADLAGVTFGLIRHYFRNKDELIEATYSTVTADMTRHAHVAAEGAGPDAAEKLSAFVYASLSDPFVTPQYLAFWSNFVGKVLFDPRIRMLHEQGFWRYRQVLTDLVTQTLQEAGQTLDDTALGLAVVKVNAVIDGMWIEACLSVDALQGPDLAQAGVETVATVLGVTLPAHQP
ncbi:TetR family transcriptional regulator [Thalassobius sp. Cn5-15]|jgi:AcrR family transcriptional regulator|uniref:TetR family transcriptional regulator n=1 Tax=Thalassobius sp. Cn5-15 TaxID=2917763 RepID=UPI001EF28853|nr:TetR family transcriptional regulator [Thalassobius sp. Cn5-15]MCG7493045.1 TetR family transcriptional regulator [Thalassobius sp. Cn5-15]